MSNYLANFACGSTVLSNNILVEVVLTESIVSPSSTTGGGVNRIAIAWSRRVRWVRWRGTTSGTSSLAVLVDKFLETNLVAHGDSAVGDSVDASSLITESTGRWTVLGNCFTPDGTQALGWLDCGTVDTGDWK